MLGCCVVAKVLEQNFDIFLKNLLPVQQLSSQGAISHSQKPQLFL